MLRTEEEAVISMDAEREYPQLPVDYPDRGGNADEPGWGRYDEEHRWEPNQGNAKSKELLPSDG